MVGASQQLIHVRCVGAGSRVLAEHREIGGHLPVEQGHLLEFRARQLGQAPGVGLGQQSGQPLPMRLPLAKPLVGEDMCHGIEVEPA